MFSHFLKICIRLSLWRCIAIAIYPKLVSMHMKSTGSNWNSVTRIRNPDAAVGITPFGAVLKFLCLTLKMANILSDFVSVSMSSYGNVKHHEAELLTLISYVTSHVRYFHVSENSRLRQHCRFGIWNHNWECAQGPNMFCTSSEDGNALRCRPKSKKQLLFSFPGVAVTLWTSYAHQTIANNSWIRSVLLDLTFKSWVSLTLVGKAED